MLFCLDFFTNLKLVASVDILYCCFKEAQNLNKFDICLRIIKKFKEFQTVVTTYGFPKNEMESQNFETRRDLTHSHSL